jgi:hypothetical protein
MDIKESIRRIIREGTIKDSLINLLKNRGVYAASEAVSGLPRLLKILELDIDDINIQEMLVKNFIYYEKVECVEVSFIQVRNSSMGNKIIDVHIKYICEDEVGVENWYVQKIINKMSTFFPFSVGKSYHPVLPNGKTKIFLDATIINDDDEEDEDSMNDEITEGELTEKCWTGYTQKGMKTMFGKRYPNCVKKTKK